MGIIVEEGKDIHCHNVVNRYVILMSHLNWNSEMVLSLWHS